MKQAALHLNLNLSVKKTRKQVFLGRMEQVVPWVVLVELIAQCYREGRTGRPPFSLLSMLRPHSMQHWFTLSVHAMGESFFDILLYREFAQLEEFGRLLLKAGTAAGATLIAAPTSTLWMGLSKLTVRGLSAPENSASALQGTKSAKNGRENERIPGVFL